MVTRREVVKAAVAAAVNTSFLTSAQLAAGASYSNTRALGLQIYTDYAYPFEIAAVILLVAIIAAIALTHRKRRETKHQNPSEQIRVRRDERLRILNIPAEKREP